VLSTAAAPAGGKAGTNTRQKTGQETGQATGEDTGQRSGQGPGQGWWSLPVCWITRTVQPSTATAVCWGCVLREDECMNACIWCIGGEVGCNRPCRHPTPTMPGSHSAMGATCVTRKCCQLAATSRKCDPSTAMKSCTAYHSTSHYQSARGFQGFHIMTSRRCSPHPPLHTA
jgi:hypothetical protein